MTSPTSDEANQKKTKIQLWLYKFVFWEDNSLWLSNFNLSFCDQDILCYIYANITLKLILIICNNLPSDLTKYHLAVIENRRRWLKEGLRLFKSWYLCQQTNLEMRATSTPWQKTLTSKGIWRESIRENPKVKTVLKIHSMVVGASVYNPMNRSWPEFSVQSLLAAVTLYCIADLPWQYFQDLITYFEQVTQI